MREFGDKDEEQAFKEIACLVPDGELAGKVWAVVQTLVATKERQARGAGAADTLQPLVTKTITRVIKTMIQEELKELNGGPPSNAKRAPTWAQRIAAGLPQSQPQAGAYQARPGGCHPVGRDAGGYAEEDTGRDSPGG